MPLEHSPRPLWLTFDCYGTLIQWDEGLRAAVDRILDEKGAHQVDPETLISVYDHHEHALEQTPPHRNFRTVVHVGRQAQFLQGELQAQAGEGAEIAVRRGLLQGVFDHAHGQLGVSLDQVVHICASPHLDHAAARDVGFRCVWIDRGTGRQLLADYTPDAILPTLDGVPELFKSLGW